MYKKLENKKDKKNKKIKKNKRMDKIIKYSIGCLALISVFALWMISYADKSWRWEFGSTPIQILDTVKDNANSEKGYEIHETALDPAVKNVPNSEHPILKTLERVSERLHFYLQWIMYVGLALGTILLIFNGFMMVTHAIHNSWDLSTIKKNVTKIVIGLFIMLGFWAIIKLILAVINMFFGLGD